MKTTAYTNSNHYSNSVSNSKSVSNSNSGFNSNPGTNSVPGIRSSCRVGRDYVTPSGAGKPIKYGDRMFARIVMGRRTILEFANACISDITELLGELRRLTRGLRGLVRLYVRNITRGWSIERPLMLYPDLFTGTRSDPDIHPTETGRHSAFTGSIELAFPRMAAPWETH